ncbi:hypothetical protein [Solibacillus sp. CAU 1738]|uniref:hypothetical protein n=1 Tax=Solibacillus sp. CAU 1738 TaxID=3140363 RepID=UPI003261CA10
MDWKTLQIQSEYVNRQINELEKLKEKKKAIEKQLKIVQIDISKYETDIQQLKLQLDKTEKHSFITSIRSLFGKSDVQEQEKLAAIKEFKLNESYAVAEEYSHQLKELQLRIDSLDEITLQNTLEKNVLDKKEWLRVNNKDRIAEIEQIDIKKQLCQRLITEIDDTIEAGKKAYQVLLTALEDMKKAKDYSDWDLFWGGGIKATKMKYDKLKDTSYFIHHAQMALQNFKNELLDVEELKLHDVEININGFVKFFNFFTDDIFSAWKVHEEIDYVFIKLQRVIDDISETINKLKDKRYTATRELQKIEKQLNQLLA